MLKIVKTGFRGERKRNPHPVPLPRRGGISDRKGTERELAGWKIRELENLEISKFVNLLIILTFAQNMQQKR